MKINRKVAAFATAAAGLVLFAGCSDEGMNRQEQEAQERITRNMLISQPVPEFDWSQLRQNLIELQTMQATGAQSTTFMFHLGVRDPIGSCPSIGAPIPTTTQLTNPDQVLVRRDAPVSVPQQDPTGVYTGDSTGTYVLCLDEQGRPYADYWEGYVRTVFAPARWDAEAGRIIVTGAPTAKFTTSRKGG